MKGRGGRGDISYLFRQNLEKEEEEQECNSLVIAKNKLEKLN